MTTTTTFQGMDPGAKNSSRVLRPPGGASNISFGTDEEKPPARKNRTASNIFAGPDDPHAHRRNNPPGGKPTGVLCGEPSAPLRRCQQATNQNNSVSEEAIIADGDDEQANAVCVEEPEEVPEQKEEVPQPSAPTVPTGAPAGRRNPPGGKSSLILG
ncbi:hypothetical protein SKAU_G00203920 [Synaphobranchus kaupii]|uniref:Hematological and neurological expressed 1 protein n=1 Tax=Synaphobranchus kaupii TaxID=118154 RepID=A0A9Q1FGI7_SYNKA|nr:hypothetical protein SKAU_G00203920 [Synaphobranchus kaupii]